MLPSLKLIAKTPENGRLEYDRFVLGKPMFRGYVSFRECIVSVSFVTHLNPPVNQQKDV